LDFPELVFISHVRHRCAELSHWLHAQPCSNFTDSFPTPMRSRMCTWWHDESIFGTCFRTHNFQGQARLCGQEYGFLRLGSAQTRLSEETDDVGGIPRAWFYLKPVRMIFPMQVRVTHFIKKPHLLRCCSPHWPHYHGFYQVCHALIVLRAFYKNRVHQDHPTLFRIANGRSY